MPTAAQRRQEEFYGNEIAISLHEWFLPKRPQWKPSPRPHARDRWIIPIEDLAACALAVESAAIVQPLAATQTSTLEQRFLVQAERWDRETAHLSSPTQRFANASYQAILGMGNDHREEMIDLLLRDMEQNRREWFWALSYLTHENPIERKDAGKLDLMIAAWVRWGRQRVRGIR